MKRTRIAVVMGGRTPEHEISLISGREVVRNLDRSKYSILPIVIDRLGDKWRVISPSKLLQVSENKLLAGHTSEIVKKSNKEVSGSRQIAKYVDVVFIAMHGPFGEDGTIQGLFELAGIKYTGPGVLASALGMDKLMFRKILKAAKIPQPNYVTLGKNEKTSKIFERLGKPPYFIKPSNQGSSVGCSIVWKKSSTGKAVKLARKYSSVVLVDKFISGVEVTCGVIGNEKPIALPLIEIIPLKGEFFDYESKYTESGAEEIVPARISKKMTERVQEMALKVYKELGCRGFSRVDFILENKKYPKVLEINTIPGLTPMSLLPKAANEAGYSYPKFLDKIINYAKKQ